MKRILLWIIAAAIVAAGLVVLNERTCRSVDVPERTIIAHAGGNVDSLRYTNSREAVMHAIARGVKYIELDVVVTPEGDPIAFHSGPDIDESGFSCDPPHLREFVETGLVARNGRRYTPLTWREINEIFLAHPDLTFVVDKTDDPDVLERYFPRLKKRMIVECFTMERLVEVSRRGFKLAMLSEEAVSPAAIVWQDIKHRLCSDEPAVQMVAMERNNYNTHRILRHFLRLCDVPIAMWTALDRDAADTIFDRCPTVRMAYTNEL